QAMFDPTNGWTRKERMSGNRALDLLMRRLGTSQTGMMATVPVEVLDTAGAAVRVSLFLIDELVLNAQPDTVEKLKQAQVILAPYVKTAKPKP
ncbi:MAG: hypothetical protein ACOY93_18535, partial [Bacillota bacterium]